MLNRIVAHKKAEVALRKRQRPVDVLRRRIESACAPQILSSALSTQGVSLIAEAKFRKAGTGEGLRSPSELNELVHKYQDNGASAIAVLADEKFFGGGVHNVELVASDPHITCPVVYKDFIVDRYQIYEARAVGADAVLIIVRAAVYDRLGDFLSTAANLDMDAIVEVFSEDEAKRAADSGARIIGVNNRDLATMEVDFRRAELIRNCIPSNVLAVSESGIRSAADVALISGFGFDAMLVGESLLAAQDVAAKVRELVNYSTTEEEAS